MHNRHFLANIQQQCRRIIISFPLYRFATQRHSRPFFYCARHFLLDPFQRRGVNQRPHRNVVAFSGVTKLNRLHRFTQPIDELIINAFLYINTFCTVTHLPTINDA